MSSGLRRAVRYDGQATRLSGGVPLPENMRRALADANRPQGLNPWDYPSSTIGAIKRAGYVTPRKIETIVLGIRKVHTVYDLSEAGQVALREGRRQ